MKANTMQVFDRQLKGITPADLDSAASLLDPLIREYDITGESAYIAAIAYRLGIIEGRRQARRCS